MKPSNATSTQGMSTSPAIERAEAPEICRSHPPRLDDGVDQPCKLVLI